MSKKEILPKMLDSDYTKLLGLSKKLGVRIKMLELKTTNLELVRTLKWALSC